MSEFILKLQSSDSLDNEFRWINLLKCSVEKRFDVAVQLQNLRIGTVHDEIFVRRVAEIDQHKNRLKDYIKVIFHKISFKRQ